MKGRAILHFMSDYLKWVKFGYGRASDEVSLEIRHGRMTRDEGLRIVGRREGRVPSAAIARFTAYVGQKPEWFEEIVARFLNAGIFKTENGRPVRDADGVLIRQ